MPIYDYRCRDCELTFAALVASSSTPAGEVTCPDCGQAHAEKLLSMRSAVLAGGVSSAGASEPSNCCASGFC